MPPKRAAAKSSTLSTSAATTKRKVTNIDPEDASDKENVENGVPAKRARVVRKKAAPKVQDPDDASEPEDVDSDDASPPKKKAKATTKASTTKAKPAAKPKAKPKAANDAKSAKKQFNEIVKETERQVKALDKKVKAMSGNSRAITISNFCRIADRQLKAVKPLAAIDQGLAFNLVMHCGDISATYLNATLKMAGYDEEHEEYFRALDGALIPIIEAREKPAGKLTELPQVPHRWTPDDADVGEFKTGRPNKQQYNQMINQRIEWEINRRAEWRQRRAECEDWVSIALADMKETRDYLDGYGVDGFFKNSIAKLEEIDAARV